MTLGVAIVALTWIPGSVGSSIGLPLLTTWGVLSGYTGLSWALPALLIGLVAATAWHDQDLPLHRVVGIVVGVSASIVFLLAAVQLVGG